MQITSNTTGFTAGVAMALEKDGRQSAVIAVKATFHVGPDGRAIPADEQAAVALTDAYRGDPATSGIVYGCEVMPLKPLTDVLVNGDAVSPTGRPVADLVAALEVNGKRKDVLVVGDRHWTQGVGDWRPSSPVPFVTMPVTYERAFGGMDESHPTRRGAELRNLVGVGFHVNTSTEAVAGKPVPNIEDPKDPIRTLSDRPRPVGFGVVGRGWQPRIAYAGTYDAKWREERLPFLPDDFDPRYHQSAPEDQQFPHFRGGETIRCLHMSENKLFAFTVPRLDIPILCRFRDRDVEVTPVLDTVVAEPTAGRFLVLWRTSVPLGRKPHALREILVGPRRGEPVRRPDGKLVFRTLADLAMWRKRQVEREMERLLRHPDEQ